MRKPIFFVFWTAAFCLGLVLVKPTGADTDLRELLILYTGNTLGELKPCGCAREEDQGGIERRAAYLKEIRGTDKNVLLLDTGDSFKEPTRQGKIKAQYLMKSMGSMNYDAVTLGEKDLVYGNRFLRGAGQIPWVATNMELDQAGVIPKYRIKRFDNGLKVAVLAVVDPELFYTGEHTGVLTTAPRETVENILPRLRQTENPDLIVLLTHMSREKALSFLDVEGIDIVVNGHIKNETDFIDMVPVRKSGRIFVQPGPRGQKVGELRISIGRQGKKTFQQRMVKLDSHVKFDPEMVKLYDKYNEEIEEIFFASLAAKRSKTRKKVYATETACKQCHAAAHDVWSQSRHGKAYDTLKKVNKAFDPECLACHTTGFNRSGGFLSEIDTPELKHIQCEVCHGPGLEHSQAPAPGWSKPADQACKQCHVKNHSPRFKFAVYWPRIKH